MAVARRRGALAVHARSGRQQTRLATRITTIPRRLDLYFADNLPRQALWSCISYFSGFYAANTGAYTGHIFPISKGISPVSHS